MAKRPYFKSGINELESLVEKHWNDIDTLKSIANELEYRKSKRAIQLATKVNERLSGSSPSSSKSGKPQASTTGAKKSTETSPKTSTEKTTEKGGGNKPPVIDHAEQKRKQTHFEESADIIQNFINALEIEVAAIKKTSQEASIELRGGYKIEKAAETYLYRFPVEGDVYIRDDSPVVIVAGGREANGSVVSTADKVIILSLDEDFGERIAFAQIKIDNSFLMERLRESFIAVDKKENVAFFNKNLLQKVIGESEPRIGIETHVEIDRGDMNDEQWKAVKVAVGSEVMFLWGPPGTGKTHSMAKIIEAFYRKKEKILLVSNTNIGVDILLEKLCDLLHDQHDEGFQKGAVLRFGTIVKEELQNQYGEYVSIDLAVERLGRDLKLEKDEVEQKITSIERKAAPLQKILRSFDEYEDLEKKLALITKDQVKLQKEDNALHEKLSQLDDRYNGLLKDLQRAEQAGTLKRIFTGLDPQKIKTKIDSNHSQKRDIEKKKDEIKREVPRLSNKKNDLLSQFKRASQTIAGKNKSSVRTELEKITAELDQLRSRLQEINDRLNQIREEVLNNCKILAATATQTYLKRKEFQSFDTVIIDEASMLILPLISYVSGLCKKNIVIAGDFRQLPPIVTSDHEAVMKWVGRDVFDKTGIVSAVNDRTTPPNLVKLNVQYRMDENICALINNTFYDGALITGPGAGSQKLPGAYPSILSNKLLIVDTSSQHPFVNLKPRTYSRYNVLHAVGIRNLAYFLSKEGMINSSNDLGIISPYSAQAKFIGKLCGELKLDDVLSGTVHKFQGNEKDVIIFDVADSYGLWKPSQFIRANSLEESGAKLLNVAASRARSCFIVFANLDYLENKLPVGAYLRNILFDMKNTGKIIDIKEIINLGPHDFPTMPFNTDHSSFTYKEEKAYFFNETNFDHAFLQDMESAKQAIVIFSAFSTPRRIAFWSDTFRKKMTEGVRIRAVTRPPNKQGSISPEHAGEAIDLLERMGVVVDLRNAMHEKICFIDDKILWHGSLNPLSHTGRTDESMMRIVSQQACNLKAEFERYRYMGSKKDASIISLIAERENPKCGGCDGYTVFHTRGRYGPYFKCANGCGWSINLDRASRHKSSDGASGPENATEETRVCDICGKPMVVRRGPYGKFYGCTGFPACKNKGNIGRNNQRSNGK